MTDRTSKIVQWFLYLLLIVSAILGMLFYVNTGSNTDTLIYWGYALLGLIIVSVIVASIFSLAMDPKGAIKFLIMAAGMIIVAVIAYSVSSNEFSSIRLEQMGITEATSKVVGAGLLITYVLLAFALLAIVFSTVSRIFK